MPTKFSADADFNGNFALNAARTCCEIWHKDGTVTSYPASANTDVAAGTAVVTALTAAASGDLIRVYRTATVTANLAKNGVNWWLSPGITINGTGSVGIFDDGGAAMTFKIGGFGSLYWQGSGATGCAIKLTHASSNIVFEGDQLLADNIANDGQAVTWQAAGTLDINCRKMGGTADHLRWQGGDCRARIQLLSDTGAGTGLYLIPAAAATGEFWADIQQLKSANPIYFSGGAGSTCKATLNLGSVQCMDSEAAVISGPGSVYLSAQRIFTAASAAGDIRILGGAFASVKIGEFLPNADPAIIVGSDSNAATKAFIEIDYYNAANDLTTPVAVEAGTVFYKGRLLDVSAFSDANGFQVDGGSLTLDGVSVKTHSGKNDLIQSAGTLSVTNTVLYDPSKISGSITTLPTTLYGTVFTHSNSPGGGGTVLNAVPNRINQVDTSGGAVSIKLPNPATTDYIIFEDLAATFDGSSKNLTLKQFSGEKINLVAGDFVVYGRAATFTILSDKTDYRLPSLPNPAKVTSLVDSHPIVIADARQSFTLDASNAGTTVTIPLAATQDIPLGPDYAITFTNTSAGAWTFAKTSGLTINGANANRTLAAATTGVQPTCSLWKTGADAWVMVGNGIT